LCWRIQLAEYQIYACPKSVVYHVGGGTLPKGNSLKTYLNFRNNRIMLYKNLRWGRRLWVLSFRNLLDSLSALKGLFTGDGGYCLAVFRAQFGFMKWWLFHRKESIFPKHKKGFLQGISKKNMVWQHFIKKKKRFTEIVEKSNK
ncbi:MAG: glycosyltransferase family 2 protein, partial [Chitinophagaceae bacterium]|nr:glycosyltransferase family 2 protein [Chitinophagaceae bacterium]